MGTLLKFQFIEENKQSTNHLDFCAFYSIGLVLGTNINYEDVGLLQGRKFKVFCTSHSYCKSQHS